MSVEQQLLINISQILKEKHNMDLPDTVSTKTDAADVNLLCSEHVKVKFHRKGEIEELAGWWCLVCKYVSHISLSEY